MSGDNSDNSIINNKKHLDSLDPQCNQLKHAYDACFNSWFTEIFLKGGHSKGPSPCDELLEAYSECVKKAIEKKKIDLDSYDTTIQSTDRSDTNNNHNTSSPGKPSNSEAKK